MNADHAGALLAQEQVVEEVLHLLIAERGDAARPHRSDDLQYAEEQLALAARDLTRAVYDLPANARPVGWSDMDGAAQIAAERQRQIDVEGWTPEHDAEHGDHDLAFAAACYVTPDYARFLTNRGSPADWPWESEAWKPTPGNRIGELVKAGALIAAEIDRLQASDGGAR